MNMDLKLAMQALQGSPCTCALCKDGQLETSDLRGVAPLLKFLASGKNYRGYSAADRIVGKAAAYLYLLLGVREIFANVMSEEAAELLEQYGIACSCDQKTTVIRNRTNTGECPMELAVKTSTEPEEARTAIQAAIQKLAKN